MDELQQYYQYLKGAGADVPDSYDSFKSTLQDPSSSQKYYQYLKDNKFDAPDTYESFSNTLGLKKKVGGNDSANGSQTASPIASQSQNGFENQSPIDLAKQSEDLSTKTQVVNNPAMTGGMSMGTSSSSTIPDANAVAQSQKINDYLKSQKIDPDQVNKVFGDMPQQAYDMTLPDGTKPQSKQELFSEWQANPIDAENKINNIKTQFALQNAGTQQSLAQNPNDSHAAQQRGIKLGNAFMQLQGSPSQSMDDYYNKIQQQQQLIGANLSGDERDKALARLQATTAPNINTNQPELLDEYNQSPLKNIVDPNEYAGLQTLKLFDPQKYQQAVDILQTQITPQYDLPNAPNSGGGGMLTAPTITTDKSLGGTLSQLTIDKQIAQENTHRQLLSIGRENDITNLTSQQYNLNKQYEQTQDPAQKQQIQSQYQQVQDQINGIKQQALSDDKNFPLTAGLKFDNEVKDITGQAGVGLMTYGTDRFVKGFQNTTNTVEDILTGLFGNKQDNTNLAMKRIGETQTYQSQMYLPANLNSENVPYTLQASKSLKDQANKILNGRSLSELSPTEQAQLKDLVASNPSQITTVNNDGKHNNFFSKATAYTMAGFTGDIASFMAQTYGLGALGLGSKAAEATTLFNTTYSDAYNNSVSEGDSPSIANQKGLVNGGIMALAGLVSSKYDAVKNMLGEAKSPIGKEILGMGEDAWNAVVNDNKSIINKIANSAKDVLGENAKMIATYGVGTSIATDLANKAIFNKNISTDDIVNNAIEGAKQMTLGSIALMGAGFLTHIVKSPLTMADKVNMWNMASDPDISRTRISDALQNNQITQKQASDRMSAISRLSELMNNIPDVNNKLKPLTDEQKVRYLYNEFVKSKANESLLTLPESQQNISNSAIENSDLENNKILQGNEKNETKNEVSNPTEEAGNTNETVDNVSQKTEITEGEKNRLTSTIPNESARNIVETLSIPEFNDFIKDEVAQQGNATPSEQKTARARYGDELVDYAVSQHPNEETKIKQGGALDEFQKDNPQSEQQPTVNSNGEVNIKDKVAPEVAKKQVGILDSPAKPFKKAVDLLGEPRKDWMYEAAESEAEQATKKDTMRGSQYFPKKITAIKFAIEGGKFQKAIEEGRMTANDAKTIIESAGLEAPKDIQDLAAKENKPTISKEQPTIKEETPKEPIHSQVEDSVQNPPTETPKNENENEDGNKVGVSHKSLTDLADKLGLKPPERGTYPKLSEISDRGRKLLEAGADPNEVTNPKQDLHERTAIGRAHLEDLVQNADEIAKEQKQGINSDEYKEALQKIEDYSKKVKSLGHDAGLAMYSLQGERDLDTGSFSAVRKAFKKSNGEPSIEETNKILDLTNRVKNLENENDTINKKLIELTDKEVGKNEPKQEGGKFENKAKNLADKFRKLKTKEFKFTDSNGKEYDLQKMGLSWNDVVELGAKAIEASGKVADGVAAVIDKIKDSDFYKNIVDKDGFEEQLKKHYQSLIDSENNLEGLQKMFADKRPNDKTFTPEEAKALWDYGKKTYLEKGVPYKDMISMVGKDLGLSFDQVYEGINTTKTKPISNEMWNKNAELNREKRKVKDFVEKKNTNIIGKALEYPSKIVTGTAVFGHGGIFTGTHAGMTYTDLPRAKYTMKAFVNGYKLAYSKGDAYNERMMQQLKDRPNYVIAQRAGLQNIPGEVSNDEYARLQKFFKKVGGDAGVKGFNAIKILRQDLFDSHFRDLSPAEQQDMGALQAIAELVNNATGATNLNIKIRNKAGDVVVDPGKVLFAAEMEAARWEKLLANPLKAANTGMRIIGDMVSGKKTVSAKDKVFARVWAKRVGWEVATYAGLLYSNSLFQAWLNPKNKVNLDDPSAPGYLRLKVGDNTIDMSSGMLGAIGLVANLGVTAVENQKKLGGDSRLKKEAATLGYYGRGKLNPFYGTIGEMALFKTDFAGNPLPFSKDTPKAGKHTLTWSEYAWEKAPIPIADAAKDIYDNMRDNGMSKPQIEKFWSWATLGHFGTALGEAGITGFHISDSHNRPSPYTDEDNKIPAFKYFIDKGMSLPNTSPTSEKIKDYSTSTYKKLSDYPAETQQQYSDLHKQLLQKSLEQVEKRNFVYVSNFGNVSLTYPESSTDRYKRKSLDAMSKDELAKVLSAAQSQATEQTKKQIFYKNKKK